MRIVETLTIAACLSCMGITGTTMAQGMPIAPQGEFREIDVSSGFIVNPSSRAVIAYDKVIEAPDSDWMRLYFADVMLNEGSAIIVTSLLDGESQRLDADSMDTWRNTTAYFNGSAVRIELIAGPYSTGDMFRLDRYAHQKGVAVHRNCANCDGDNRDLSYDNRFGRIFPVLCSATIYNEDSCIVTAGHCLGQGGVLQFNIPMDGWQPPVNDQFPIVFESGLDGGVGMDYGAITVAPNEVGEMPYERYGSFAPIHTDPAEDWTSVTIENFGYGNDTTDPGRSFKQQSSTGIITGSYGGDARTLTFDTFIEGGSSGSSLIHDGQIIGIVTHCDPFSCIAIGQRIDVPEFEEALQSACSSADPLCPGDFDGSGVVDVSDLLAVIAGWDDPYNVNDLLLVISEWNATCP